MLAPMFKLHVKLLSHFKIQNWDLSKGKYSVYSNIFSTFLSKFLLKQLKHSINHFLICLQNKNVGLSIANDQLQHAWVHNFSSKVPQACLFNHHQIKQTCLLILNTFAE